MQKVSNYKTAAAYAEAWFNAALDSKIEDIVFDEVKALKEGITSIFEVWNKFSQPLENEEDKYSLITSFAEEAALSQISKSALQIIAENNRLDLISIVLDKYIELYYKNKGIIEVTVDTAIKLSDKQDNELRKVLEQKLSSSIIIKYQIKPEVLGGLSVRYKSFLIDDTISSKLARIEQTLGKAKG